MVAYSLVNFLLIPNGKGKGGREGQQSQSLSFFSFLSSHLPDLSDSDNLQHTLFFFSVDQDYHHHGD